MNILQQDATGEVPLDFIVSTKDAKPNGKYTVEWDAYRYSLRGCLGKDRSAASFGLIAWAVHHRRTEAGHCETKIPEQGTKP